MHLLLFCRDADDKTKRRRKSKDEKELRRNQEEEMRSKQEELQGDPQRTWMTSTVSAAHYSFLG